MLNSCFVSSSFSSQKTESYKIYAKLDKENSISIVFINKQTYIKYSNIFTKEKIEKLTKAVGSQKSSTTFWKMVNYAFQKNSKIVSFFILHENEVHALLVKSRISKPFRKPKHINQKKDMKPHDHRKLYLFIHLHTEFENLYFPLVLKENQFNDDEMIGMLIHLTRENTILKQNIRKSKNCKELIQQVSTLEKKVKRMEVEKEKEIQRLKMEIEKKKMLEYTSNYVEEAHEYAKAYHKQQLIKELQEKNAFFE